MSTRIDSAFADLFDRPFHVSLGWESSDDSRVLNHELSIGKGLRIDEYPQELGGDGLEAMMADFREFLRLQSIPVDPQDEVPILRFLLLKGEPARSFAIEVTQEGITISADTSDGIKRALVWMEDEMQSREGPRLPLGIVEKQEIIRTRISRCFYGPIQRPPLNRHELADDVNYYPDTYLNRLAHDGVTALWITIKFRESVPSKIFPDYGKNAEKHLAKLRATVERCARYGIKIYVFCIEPAALPLESPILREHPELRGSQFDEQVAFCTETEIGQAYIEEASKTLFQHVPGLGGLILIPVGERLTSCVSVLDSPQGDCPRCMAAGRYQVLSRVFASFRRGMDQVAPEAELIAWPYGQMIHWGKESVAEAAAHIPRGVVLQHNYESGGTAHQLGAPRPLWDYWLSWTGVSPLFDGAAHNVLRNGGRIMAKLQVGTSHENATVPFMPVPGLLYRKYWEMHRLGVTGAMQSWYFGNYPSLMTRAAGLLSYAPLPATEEEFLILLAGKEWGKQAKSVARAWKAFGKAYENFPATHLFSYYGPVQNGVTWPLYLEPQRLPLSPSWKLDFPASGDYLPHCFSHLFTLRELHTLCSRMLRHWKRGIELLGKVYASSRKTSEQTHEWQIAQAIYMQFQNAVAILSFYMLREQLANATSREERLSLLNEMEAIAREEIRLRREFVGILKKEPMLGHHSEAEGYKITAALVEESIQALLKLLKTEFPALRRKVGYPMEEWFGVYTGRSPKIDESCCVRLTNREDHALPHPMRYWLSDGSENSALPVTACFKLYQEKRATLEFQVDAAFQSEALDDWEMSISVTIEPTRMSPPEEVMLDANGVGKVLFEDGYLGPEPAVAARWISTPEGRSGFISVPVEKLYLPRRKQPFRMNVRLLFFNKETAETRELSWIKRFPMKDRLVWRDTNPATDFGWVYPA